MGPRPLRPKDDPSPPEGADAAETKSNKRKAISSACIPCRKRKSKCDGNVPSCSTCMAVYNTECFYDADSDHRRKGALKRDIQSLQQQNDALDIIVASLRSLPESEAVSLLHTLRGDSNPETVAASLKTNVRLPNNYAPQTLEAEFSHPLSHSTSVSSVLDGSGSAAGMSPHQTIDSAYTQSTASPTPATAGWFRTAQDAELVEHLLNLFFTWVHPFYLLFSREHFLQDMGHGRTEYCSAMLVNAVLAYACHYSDRPVARADPGVPTTAGDEFFAEAKRLLDRDEKPCLTTVQALGIMSARECSHGRDSNAYQLAGRCNRMALELGLHLSVVGSGLRSADVEVRKITFWGVFNLETLCSVAFGRLSQMPRAAADIAKPTINDRSESLPWRPYEDTHLSRSPAAEQPSRQMAFADHYSKLSELASDMVNTFYAPQERFTSRRLAAAYTQYQNWHSSLPEAFKLENTSLPHVLVLHMYYYACVLHLFRPYIKLDLSGAGLYPRDTCTFCANEISMLMNALRGIYGLRRVTLPVPALLLSASTIHLLNLPNELASTHLSQALQDMQAMSVNHHFAAKSIDVIRSLAAKWSIALPDNSVTSPAFGANGYRSWPSPPLSTFFAPSIPRKSSADTRASSESSSTSGQGPFRPPQRTHSNQVQPLYSDPATPADPHFAQQNAFWTPFPLQGVPMQSGPVNEMMFDFSSMDGTTPNAQQWPVFGNSGAPPTSDPSSTQASQLGGIETDMGGSSMGNWGWQ